MNLEFKIKIYLPVSKKYVFLKQLSNYTYKILLKHITNKNVETCNEFINDLLKTHTNTDISNICFIDKFVILLYLRCISVSDTLIHTIEKEKTKYNLKYNIYDAIKNITESNIEDSAKIITYNKYKIQMCIPKNLLISIDEISNFIDTINIGDYIIPLSNLPEQDKTDIVNNLPGNLLYEIYEEIHKIVTLINNIELIIFRTDIDKNDTQTLKLFLDKDNMFITLSIFFNDLLMNQFIKQFVLTKEYHISCEYFDSLPPIESEILFNFHKEIEEKQEQENKTKPPGMNIPMPPAGGDMS